MSGDRRMFSGERCVWGEARYLAPLLDRIAEQAGRADETHSISAELIAAIKKTDVMRLSASAGISGLDETTVAVGNELRAVAPLCASTAWCLWNHLCTFHHFAGVLGPRNADFLGDAVSKHEWVCFPAGARRRSDEGPPLARELHRRGSPGSRRSVKVPFPPPSRSRSRAAARIRATSGVATTRPSVPASIQRRNCAVIVTAGGR